MTNIDNPAPPDQPAQPPVYPYPPFQPQPQPEPPRRRWPARHKILTALVAVIALIIGGGIAGAIAGSGQQHAPATAAAPAASASSAPATVTDPNGMACTQLDTSGYCPGDDPTATPAPTGPDMLAMGTSESVTENGTPAATVTVSGLTRTTQPASQYGSAPAHGWYVIVTVTYTADPAFAGGFTYNPLDFYALAQGQHYGWDSGNAAEALDPSRQLDSGTLAAGETTTGQIAFDVPSRYGQIVYAPNADGQPLAEWSY